MRLYSLADLRRGDLGCTLGWTFSGVDGAAVAVTKMAQPEPEPGRMAPSARESTSTVAPSGPPRVRRAVSLEEDDLRMVHRHLLCTEVFGPGATVVPRIFEGLRVLVALGEGNHLLRASELLRLLGDRARVRIHCCSKTLARSLAAVAARTPLLRRVGRRWRLCLGELLLEHSELLASIKAECPSGDGEAPKVPSAPTDTPVNDAPFHGHVPPVPVAETIAEPEPQASQIVGERVLNGREPTPTPSIQQGRMYTAGRPLLWTPGLSRLPDNEAASRWQGRKPRGPPKG